MASGVLQQWFKGIFNCLQTLLEFEQNFYKQVKYNKVFSCTEKRLCTKSGSKKVFHCNHIKFFFTSLFVFNYIHTGWKKQTNRYATLDDRSPPWKKKHNTFEFNIYSLVLALCMFWWPPNIYQFIHHQHLTLTKYIIINK